MNHHHTVSNVIDKIRLSDYVHVAFPHLISRKAGQKAIKKDQILLNNDLGFSYDWIKNGDNLTLIEQEIITPKLNFQISVIYENEHFGIIDKPAGINVSGNRKAVSHYLNSILQPSFEEDVLPRFTPVHRLDRDTRGLLIIAKSKRAQLDLQLQFSSSSIKKVYRAVVIGIAPHTTGTINTDLEGKSAITQYKVITQTDSCLFGSLSYLELNILTGRKHQIRKHLSSIGLPILGDKLYNNYKPIGVGKGMFLFANQLTLNHPVSGEVLSFNIPLPPKVKRVLDYYGEVEMHKNIS